jgi:hypothetical protein
VDGASRVKATTGFSTCPPKDHTATRAGSRAPVRARFVDGALRVKVFGIVKVETVRAGGKRLGLAFDSMELVAWSRNAPKTLPTPFR